MNLKILNSVWFTEMGSTRPIGIILCEDLVTKEVKSFIGTGDGFSQQMDQNSIDEKGAKFPVPLAKMMFGLIWNTEERLMNYLTFALVITND